MHASNDPTPTPIVPLTPGSIAPSEKIYQNIVPPPRDEYDWTTAEEKQQQATGRKKPEVLESEFLALCLKHEECVERWTTEGIPPLSRFDDTEHARLARAIHEVWTCDKVLLTQKTFLTMLDAAGISKLGHVAEECLYNRVAATGRVKPADLPMIGRQIMELPGTPEGRRRTSLNLVDAIRDAAKTSIERLLSHHLNPDDMKHVDRLESAVKELKRSVSRAIPKQFNIRQSGVQYSGIVKPPIVVDGLLRRGQVANIVSSSKLRKTWAINDLALCITNGQEWLGRFKCEPAKVLVIDNELRTWELQDRTATLMEKKGANLKPYDYIALRDDGLMDIDQLEDQLPLLIGGGYEVIILDALYRFYEEGYNENDNAECARLYSRLDAIATQTGAAIIVVHHASKGDQSLKSTTDAGAGAGAQSRAVDTHIVLRPVTQPGKAQDDAPERAILTAAVRSFPPTGKIHLAWDFPFWTAVAPEDVEEEDQPPMKTEEYARAYAGEGWESRVTIESRAREEGLSVRASRELFDGAVAENKLELKTKEDGKAVLPKQYKLPADQRDWTHAAPNS